MAHKVNKLKVKVKKTQPKTKKSKGKVKVKSKSRSRSRSRSRPRSKSKFRIKSPGRDERLRRKAMTKKHKQKLLDAKLARQRERNHQMIHMRRKMEQHRRQNKPNQLPERSMEGNKEKNEDILDKGVDMLKERLHVEGCWRKFTRFLEDLVSNMIYFLTVTMRSERTFDWLVFLANNLGLYQEYEINNYGQRLSPRTGRPVLLSLGPFRVVQVVESANQVRSYWDPYIREYLKNSKLTTDCWRANRMALQVALCMDDSGQMFDMPIEESMFQSKS